MMVALSHCVENAPFGYVNSWGGPVLSARAVRNIEAVVVLVGAFAASFFIPSETLVPIAAVVLAVSIGGVFAIRARMQRLGPEEFGPERVPPRDRRRSRHGGGGGVHRAVGGVRGLGNISG